MTGWCATFQQQELSAKLSDPLLVATACTNMCALPKMEMLPLLAMLAIGNEPASKQAAATAADTAELSAC